RAGATLATQRAPDRPSGRLGHARRRLLVLPLHLALWLGQDSLLVLAGLCGGYAALKRRREGWAGAALVLVSLKPQLLPAVLLLLALQRHWKALAVFAASLAGLSAAAMPVLGVA